MMTTTNIGKQNFKQKQHKRSPCESLNAKLDKWQHPTFLESKSAFDEISNWQVAT
jgi:hypothetical protein